MKALSIRWKLTLWYGGVLALVLAAFSAVVFFVMRHQLLQRIDQGLTEELADVLYEVKRADNSSTLEMWLGRRFARHEGFDFQITRAGGERFFQNERMIDKSLPLPPVVPDEHSPLFQTVAGHTGRARTVSVAVQGPDGRLLVQVARSLASFDQESQALLFTFLVTGPLMLLVAVAGGSFLARRALAPVENMTRTADEISADRLSKRLQIDNPNDELGRLGSTLNRMIERLEQSFLDMQRFTADAAHELRTPLAIIRNEAEVALRAPRSSEEYCRALENLLEETVRLSTLADQLLFLCRQDAGLHQMNCQRVAVDTVIKEVVGNMQLVAEAKAVVLSFAGDAPTPCWISADAGQVRRVLYNVLDNAIKYTEPGGKVTVALHAENQGNVLVSIQDTGIGIPAEHLARIFDRFYRVDSARTGDNGAGLGLALCQSIMKSLGGTIHISSEVGHGTQATLTFNESRPIIPGSPRS